MKKILLICNKRSGKAYVERYVNKIIKILKKQSFEVDIKNTKINYGADQIIKDYNKNVDLFLICGGDGTLSQTINGIINENRIIPILYIPFGTTNDFAKTLKICTNKLKCVKNIKKYNKKKIDIGKFNNQYFYYVAVFGLLSDISYTTPQEDKNLYGRFAYYKQALKESKTRKVYHVKVESENKIIEDDIIYASISNSTSIAGFKWFKDGEAKLDDGEFEVILIKKINSFIDLIKAFFTLLFKIKNEKYMYCFTTSHLKIQCKEDVAWTLDGEFGGNVKQVIIDNQREKIEFLVK